MKIFYVAESVVPSRTANSIHVMNMCHAFAEQGHEVTLWIPDRKLEREISVDNVFDFYGVKVIFKIKYLAWGYFYYGWIYSCFHFAYQCIKYKPELIYARFLYASIIPSLMGFKVVCESHAPVWVSSPILGSVIRLLCKWRRIQKLVLITEALKSEYIKKGYDVSLFYVAPDGAQLLGVVPNLDRWPGRPRNMQIGFVGQLYPGKGMEIVGALANTIPDMDFHVVGGFEDDISKWKEVFSSSNLYFHGFVPQSRISSYINKLDVCLLPNQISVQTYGHQRSTQDIGLYTSPLKMFDYMAHGKPIVSSDLPVLREILHSGIAKFASSSDLDEWIIALNELRDPSERARIGDAARIEFESRFTWKTRAKNLLESITR